MSISLSSRWSRAYTAARRRLVRGRSRNELRNTLWRVPNIEVLEKRTLLALSSNLIQVGPWQAEGPQPVHGGQVAGIPDQPVIGAVRAIAVQPDLPATVTNESQIVYIGTANGGVWRTLNIDAPQVNWEPIVEASTGKETFPSTAIGAVAVSPANPNVVYAGTGKFSSYGATGTPVGLYRTLNGNNVGTPSWEHLTGMTYFGATDKKSKNIFAGLPISSIALSPLDPNVLLVGTIAIDTEGAVKDVPPGLLRSEDGAVTWTRISGSINAPDRANNDNDKEVDEIGERNANDNVDNDRDGVIDETDDLNFPQRSVFDLAWIPGSSTVFAGTGVYPFFYRSKDSGKTWEAVGKSIPNTLIHNSGPDRSDENLRFAVHSSVNSATSVKTTVVYAGWVRNSVLTKIYRTDDLADALNPQKELGDVWTEVALPPNIHPGKQGETHFSIAVDPTNPNQIFVGGDTQPTTNENGCQKYEGRVFRGNFTSGNTPNASWEPLFCSSSSPNGALNSDTAPHADSRDMKFLPGHPGQMLQGDDGGIYLLSNSTANRNAPAGSQRIWSSKIGDLQISEVTYAAYDSTNNIFFAGLQDNGSVVQSAANSDVWDQVLTGDGYVVAADPTTPSTHYIMGNNFDSFYRQNYTSASNATTTAVAVKKLSTNDQTFVDNNSASDIPFVFNSQDPKLKLIGLHDIYVSNENWDTLFPFPIEKQASSGERSELVTALAYGGKGGRDVAYLARGDSIAVRRPDRLLLSPQTTKGVVAACGPSNWQHSHYFTDTGYTIEANTVYDIAVGPNDWRDAFAVGGDNNVYRTVDGGDCWFPIQIDTGVEARSIDIADPDPTVVGDEVVFVGTNRGVYRSILRDDGVIVGFTKFGSGLPNVIINDIHYDKTDNLLYVATLGRGVWKMTSASIFFPIKVVIDGTGAAETITLRLNPTTKALEILDGTSLHRTYPSPELIDTIVVNGKGGSDKLIIDNTMGFLANFGKRSRPFNIIFNAGEDPADANGVTEKDEIVITNSTVPKENLTVRLKSKGAEAGEFFISSTKTPRGIKFTYDQVDSVPTSAVPITLASVGVGIQNTAEAIASAGNGASGGVAGAVTKMANGKSPNGARRKIRSFAPDGFLAAELKSFTEAPAIETSFLNRILEQGANGFLLGKIGTDILTPLELRNALDDLDDIPNNVGLTTTTDAQGVLTGARFDVQIEKTLFGSAAFDTQLLNGVINVDAMADLFADVRVHMVFGFDSQGYYVDPNPLDANGSPIGPEISFRNIRGTLSGKGRVGIVDVNVENGVLTTDPDVAVTMDIVLPTSEASADGLIRDEDWYERNIQDLTDFNLVADPGDGVADISLAADFTIDLFESVSLPTFGLGLQWPDANDLTSGIAVPKSGESIAKILDFLNANTEGIVTGIQTIAGAVEEATGVDVLDKKIPLINKTLGEVLDTAPTALVIAATDIFSRSTPTVVAGNAQVFVMTNDLKLSELGIEVGNIVDYASSSGATLSAVVVEVSVSAFTIEFPETAAPPSASSAFSIHRSGKLESQLRSLLNGVPVQIPSLQDLIRELERATGIELFSRVQFVGTIGAPDFAVQIPLTFDPKPRTFRLPIDFASKADGLKLDASATAEVIVDPKFEITLGVRLAKNGSDGNALSIFDRVYVVATIDPTPSVNGAQPTGIPLASLDVTVRLNDPQVQGSIGFLDVVLSEDRTNGAPLDDPNTPIDEDGNKGIHASLVAKFDLKDADTDTSDQRITLQNLVTKPLDVLAFDLDGSIDIDGLKIAATVGGPSGLSLGTVKISLDGESTATAPGRINSFADLSTVFSNIQVSADFSALQSFRNISAADVLAALDLLIEKLQATGRGDIFSKPIPVVNRSVADLIDLGQVVATTLGDPANDSSIATVAKFQDYINQKLILAGLPATVDVILSNDAVRFKFAVSKTFSNTTPLAFQFGTNGLSVDGNANLTLAATGKLDLTFGILTGAGLSIGDRFFLDTDSASPSGVTVSLLADSGYTIGSPSVTPIPLNLDVVLGPISFKVVDGRVLVNVSAGANLSTTNANRRIPLKDLGSASIQPQFNGSVQAVIPIDGDNSGGTVGSRPNTLTGSDALILVGGNFTSFAAFTSEFATTAGTGLGLSMPTGLSTPIASNVLPQNKLRIEAHRVTELLSAQFLNFGSLIEGLERLLELGDRALDLDLLDRKIPFIGKSVRDGLNFLESDQPGAKTLRTVINALLANGGDGLKANASNAGVDAALNVLRTALAGIPNIAPIGNFDSDPAINSNDLIVATKNGAETTGVIVRFKYNPGFVTSRDFDLGIDFLNLQSSGEVTLNGNLELNIGFGISKTEGFFFLTDLPQPEFKIGGRIEADLDIAAKLGALDVSLSIEPTSYLAVDFAMNMVDPSGDGKLTLSELTDFSKLNLIVPSNSVQLNVESHLVGLFETKINRNNQLPSFSAGLAVDWRIPDATQPDGGRPIDILHLSALTDVALRTPTVKIQNVVLDVGSFVTSIVKPIFEKISASGLIPPQLKTALETEVPLLKKPVKTLLRDAIVANPSLTPEQKESRLRTFDLLLNITTNYEVLGLQVAVATILEKGFFSHFVSLHLVPSLVIDLVGVMCTWHEQFLSRILD